MEISRHHQSIAEAARFSAAFRERFLRKKILYLCGLSRRIQDDATQDKGLEGQITEQGVGWVEVGE